MYILSQLKQTKGSGIVFYGVVPELVFGDPEDAKLALFTIITEDAGEEFDLGEDYEERFSSVIVYDERDYDLIEMDITINTCPLYLKLREKYERYAIKVEQV